MKKAWPVPEWQEEFNYKLRPRKFGSPRPGGRLHAGCDLYAPLGSPVLAIADGYVISAGDFYCHTHQITIDHGPLGVVRYGEDSPENHISGRKLVKAGEQIGQIGRLIGIHAHPMLHLEWYDRKVIGHRIFRPDQKPYLRSDLLKDSTELLDSLLCLRKAAPCTVK